MRPNCPNTSCKNDSKIRKLGFFYRKSDAKKVARFLCTGCKKSFSSSTNKLEYGFKIRREIPLIQALLCSSVSIRRIAKILKINRKTVERKIEYLYQKGIKEHQFFLKKFESDKVEHLQFDDLITIEHTKLKPLSVSFAINAKTREFLSFEVSRIPAFGLLAEKSRKKYGKRINEHSKGLRKVFTDIKKIISPRALIESDEHRLYRSFVDQLSGTIEHIQYKGGRGAIAGQGELKKLKYDPLFTLNHNFAMLRANINRLVRKTWCTTKKPDMLRKHIQIYINYHNQNLI